jgi:FlaA1/EpsC-like NDP-sugar epimerase
MLHDENDPWRCFLPASYDLDAPPSTLIPPGRSVLVTGAGGYIGSALVKALAGAAPRSLVLLDASEQNLFDIDRHLDSVPHAAFLGSVDDRKLLDRIFARYRPEVVYHAAAFKHVPLLERNPVAAIRNNALGTYTLAQAGLRHGTARLVLVSTDKAVRPHSAMGVSKRIAELAVVALSNPACRMNAIRLGNVIGSSGSVVPEFHRQIAAGGPVTVTHPEVSRWFLSPRAAVDAILAAGNVPCEGRILLPELGEAVRIAALAAFLIGAAGKDIPIVYTGLRPGDKLEESLVSSDEVQGEFVDGLQIIETTRLAPEELEEIMRRLAAGVACDDAAALIDELVSIVPEYVPSELLR